MKRLINDLTGKKFGRLEVIGVDPDCGRKTYYYCRCECGNTKRVRGDSLMNGAIKSCGCLKREQDAINLTANHSHNANRKRLYDIWYGMKRRCYDPKDKRYECYGGRGVTVCDEWKNDFACFLDWAMSSGYDDNLTIDRINNDGNYSPENCRWADVKTQARNRRSNVCITIGNSKRTLMEWCEIFNVDYKTVHARYWRNESIDWESLFNR